MDDALESKSGPSYMTKEVFSYISAVSATPTGAVQTTNLDIIMFSNTSEYVFTGQKLFKVAEEILKGIAAHKIWIPLSTMYKTNTFTAIYIWSVFKRTFCETNIVSTAQTIKVFLLKLCKFSTITNEYCLGMF